MALSMETEPAFAVAPVSVKQTDTIAAQPVTGKYEEYQYGPDPRDLRDGRTSTR